MTDLESQLRTMIRSIVREEIDAIKREHASDEYLSTARAGELADVAEGTIRRWIREGRLPGRKAGRCLRVLKSDLEQLLRSGATANDDETPEQIARREFG